MLAVAVALTVLMVGTGCGAKNDDIVATQKETIVSAKDKKVADKKDTKEIAKESTDKQKQMQQQETEVNAEQEVVAQQAVAVDNSTVDTKGSSNNEANNTNTANRPSTNTTSTSGNGHVTNTNAGSNPAPNTNNSSNTSGSPTPAPTPTPTPTQHQHNWVHVDATGHNETVVVQAAWDEQVPVYEEKARSICNQCGADITDCCDEHMEAGMLAGTCWGWHVEYIRVQTGTKTVHHDVVTEQRWVQDTPAYEQCSGCGATR